MSTPPEPAPAGSEASRLAPALAEQKRLEKSARQLLEACRQAHYTITLLADLWKDVYRHDSKIIGTCLARLEAAIEEATGKKPEPFKFS